MQLRDGAALVEALVATVLAALVAAAGTALLQAQSRVATNVTLRSERNDAARSALLTLQAELREASAVTDVHAVARDSIAARIFRGLAIVCAVREAQIYVRYRGLRLPDIVKDSMLQVGVENSADIEAVAPQNSGCSRNPDEVLLALVITESVAPGSMWLIFESGSYHLSGHALRYRRGSESRQPITNEVLDDRGSSFAAVGDSITRAVDVSLKDRYSISLRRSTIAVLNSR